MTDTSAASDLMEVAHDRGHRADRILGLLKAALVFMAVVFVALTTAYFLLWASYRDVRRTNTKLADALANVENLAGAIAVLSDPEATPTDLQAAREAARQALEQIAEARASAGLDPSPGPAGQPGRPGPAGPAGSTMPPSPPAGTEPSPSSPTTASPPTTRPRILPTLPTLPPLLPRLTVPELRALAVDAHHARAPEPPYALGIAAAVAGATLIVLVGAEVILYRRSRK